MEEARKAWKRAWLLRGGMLLGGIVVCVGGFVVIELFGLKTGGSIVGGVTVASGLALACISAVRR